MTPNPPLTGAQVAAARQELGQAWGLGRALLSAELGRVLGLRGRDPGEAVHDWEKAKDRPVSGPVSLAIELMLAGARPEDLEARLRPGSGRNA